MKTYEYESLLYKKEYMLFPTLEDHRQVIDDYARRDYRFVGVIPTEVDLHGCPRKVDLIFEKESE